MTRTTQQPPGSRPPGPNLQRIAIGAGAAVLVLAVAALAFGAGLLQTPASQPAAQPNSADGGWNRSVPGHGPGANGRGMGNGLRGMGRDMRGPKNFGLPGRGLSKIGFRQITISAISGSSVTLQTDDGWTRTITVTGSTMITRAGQAITVNDLKVGDQVRFTETRDSDGTYTVTAIEVVLPRAAGTVTATTADTITIQRPDGTTMTIHIGSATTFQVPGIAIPSVSTISVGMLVWARGTQNADGSLQAVTVYARPQH